MKPRKLFVILVMLLLSIAELQAQNYKHQLGIRLGSADQALATGISYRYHFSGNKAIEAIANFNEPFSIGVLYEIFNPTQMNENLRFFYGAGGYAGFASPNNLGIAGIAGLDYQFRGQVPVNLSIDWKPELNILDEIRFRAATVGVSVRFSF